MRVIPGSHANGFSEYVTGDYSEKTFGARITHVDGSRAVYFELEPRECSLHDGRIIHGATPNTSPFRRCGYTMRYVPASVRFYPEKNPTDFKIRLARGTGRAGNSDANVG
jgi:ectoine hydroxylase-related dioxygenase (phytanoyl-CoA dioxygenase family)